jgi:hypothetical protein
MKMTLLLAAFLCGLVLLTQCSTVESVDREDGEEWNEGVVWKPRTQGGKDFVPLDFAGVPQDGPGRGRWVVDPQDGYRFYVPESGTKRFSKPVLEAEAQKATNPLTKGQQNATNAVRSVSLPVLATVALLTPPLWFAAFHGDDDSGPGDPLPSYHEHHYLASERRHHYHGGSHSSSRSHSHSGSPSHGNKSGGGKQGSNDNHHTK